jgi:glycosyltransferase involved in cell wall biosynthesis
MSSTSPTISAVMIAKDAAATVESSLRSLQFCDEVVVILDSASSDQTESIARHLATRVEIRDWQGYGRTKQAAVELARSTWVLSIDADETVTEELAQSIRDVVRRNDPNHHAYQLRRRTRYLGRWIRYGDWGRDRVLRVFRRSQGRFTDAPVHESVRAPGPKPVLPGWLMHEGDQTISSYLIRLDRYTTLAAESLQASGRKASILSLVVRPLFKFIQAYILRVGFLDGWQGLVLAWYSAVYVFTKYAKLRTLNRQSSD